MRQGRTTGRIADARNREDRIVTLENVSLDQRDGISVMRMNRPPANAFTLEFAEEFAERFSAVLKTDSKALVVTGSGDFFSGGLDLRLVPNYSLQRQRTFLELLNRMIGALYACPLPVVAAVNGHAIAGAFVLALSADYRIGPSGDSRFGLTEARAGIPFPAVPAVVVQAELSPPDVRYTTLYARNFGPSEAVARGLLDELQPPGKVLERAIYVARDLASMPAGAYSRIKHQFRAKAIAQIEKLNAEQSDPMLDSWLSDEAAEASDSILRAPR
jgi:enoyl-CoA hydratase